MFIVHDQNKQLEQMIKTTTQSNKFQHNYFPSGGFLVLESGEVFKGCFLGGMECAGEVVFNTSHSGYEEIATDPSYFHQIIVMTSPMQGNYGQNNNVWESDKIHIQGLICVEMQYSLRDQSWGNKLLDYGVPILSQVDTRQLTLHLRQQGSVWGALVRSEKEKEALKKATRLIKNVQQQSTDWPFMVAKPSVQTLSGKKPKGPVLAVIDFGVKQSIIQQLLKRCSQLWLFPPRTHSKDILKIKPDGILLSNGPGDPMNVKQSVKTVRDLLGKVFIFGICMGHQILALALGGKTYKLKFGHRGSNHPVRDQLLNIISVTSQNHGYAVKANTLPSHVRITHTNLNDQTVEGFFSKKDRCMGIQFHPESSPGPHESRSLFDVFIKQLKKTANK